MLKARDRLILISVVSGFAVNIILWVLLLIKFGVGNERVPLHFNIIYGIDLLGGSNQLYQLPLVGLVSLILNSFLAKIFYPLEKVFSYFLTFAAAAIQLILLVAAISIVILNA